MIAKPSLHDENRLEVVSNVIELNTKKIGGVVESYLEEWKKRNLNTYKNYRTDIIHFFEFHFGKTYQEVTFNELNSELTDVENLIEYFNRLFERIDTNGERAFSNSTINRKQTSIKGVLRYLRMKKLLMKDISDLNFIRQFPKDTESIEMIPFETALKYVEWFKQYEEDRPLEKYLITKLAIDTGLRATELISLKWAQFTIDDGIVIMRGLGKGNKKWIEKISLELYKELECLKREDGSPMDNVFSIKYHALPNMMNRAKRALGHEGRNYTFHSFKKTSVNMAYRLTGDILESQRKGRHSSLDTTRIYLQEEDYGMTGLISLGGECPNDLYKNVSHETLVEAISKMNKDFLFILNHKLHDNMSKKN